MLLYILLLRRHHCPARAACRTMWTRSWIDWRQRQGVLCNSSKRAGYGRSRNARVYVGCTVHHVNMEIWVCAVCVRVCICERVLTIVVLRVGERSCVRGYARKYYLLL